MELPKWAGWRQFALIARTLAGCLASWIARHPFLELQMRTKKAERHDGARTTVAPLILLCFAPVGATGSARSAEPEVELEVEVEEGGQEGKK